MENVNFINIENPDGTISAYAIIDHGNAEFTSMLKAEYDRRQAEQSTPIVTDEAEAK